MTRTSSVPELGQVVLYRSRTGSYTVPAIVNCTSDSIDPKGVELGHVPALSGSTRVHLTVFTPGKPGTAREGTEVRSANTSGCYQEWDVPYAESGDEPGSWRHA